MATNRTRLFKAITGSERKNKTLIVRVSESERDEIHRQAGLRNLPTVEFMRRAALSRRADVDYEQGIMLQLMDVVRSIREIHKAMVERNITPPEEIWLPLMEDAKAAMLRIGT